MPYEEALQKKLEELKQEYAKTKYNKATDKHLGLLRARMAKIRRELELIKVRKSKKGIGFGVRKSGDATVVLVGFPTAGKSSLLERLTNAKAKITGHAFTTLEVIPGVLYYNGAHIQILDIPGLIEGAHIGKGEGIKVASVIRIADLLVFVIDINAQNQLEVLLEELDQLGIKVNKQRPAISLEKTDKGGIEINSQISSETKREITELLNGMGIYNAKVSVPQGTDIDEIEDALFESTTYVKGIVALNKIDIAENGFEEEAKKIEEKHKMKVVPISAKEGTNIEVLKQAIFEEVGLIRVYLQPKTGAEKVNAGEPMVVKRGSTVLEVAKKLNSKTAQALRFAYVTGKSVKFARQKVGREHVLEDEDVVTLVYDRHL